MVRLRTPEPAFSTSKPSFIIAAIVVPEVNEPVPPLKSTGDVLRDSLKKLVGGPHAVCDHLDVETYTWNVLPEGSRPRNPGELVDGIAAELGFARALLDELEVKP